MEILAFHDTIITLALVGRVIPRQFDAGKLAYYKRRGVNAVLVKTRLLHSWLYLIDSRHFVPGIPPIEI